MRASEIKSESRSGKGQRSDLVAIGFALAGFTWWVLTDTCVKLVGQSGLPAYEMVAFLGLFMALSLAVYAGARGEIQVLRPRRLDCQLLRACLDMVNNVCVVIALRHLSLTLFYILVFMSPMVIALLCAIFLREGLPWRRAAAIAAGFAGVVIAVNPFGLTFARPGSGIASSLASGQAREGDWIGYTACLVCVACFSVNMVWSRVLTRTEKPESLAFFSGLVTAVIGFALLLLLPEPGAARLTAPLLAGLFAMGLFCALGTLCFYIAVKHTSAANVSQYHYTQLITGTLLSYWIWHTRPGLFVLLGGTLIFGSGIYIAAEARNAARATEQEAGPEAGREVGPLTEGN